MAEKEKRGLGRGLSALMADVDLNDRGAAPADARPVDQKLPIERVSPNPDQPRRDFDETALKELSDSIAEKGIIQPLIVRADPSDPGQYQIVAGGRGGGPLGGGRSPNPTAVSSGSTSSGGVFPE